MWTLSNNQIDAVIGQKFGKLTVLEAAGRDIKYGKVLYRCQCDCGNENFIVFRSSILAHRVRSCGCGHREANERKLQDLTGQKFNMLTAIRIGPKSKSNNTQWYCLCDCGRETLLCAQDLKNGSTKSCGCLKNRMIQEKSLIGKIFDRLTVVLRGPNDRNGTTQWCCDCNCGSKNILIMRASLLSGRTRSCGCLNNETLKNNHFKKHGIFSLNPKFYSHYSGMIERCSETSGKRYECYMGRGIKVCDRWSGEDGPANFYADMFFTWKKGLTLDRIDNNKNYSPENCRWATIRVQSNNKRTNIKYNFQGQLKTLAEISYENNIPYYLLWSRVRQLNWSLMDAINIPSQKGHI